MIEIFNLNIDSFSFTGTAVIVGYLLSNEFSVLEQAALGAWFNVIGDILASNASYQSILDDKNDNSKIDLDTLNKAVEKLKDSINKIQKEKKSSFN